MTALILTAIAANAAIVGTFLWTTRQIRRGPR